MDEKQILLKKINNVIDKKRNKLLNKLPQVHKVNDGIIIRFFSTWNNCAHNESIKYKKIVDIDNPHEHIMYYYLPKDTFFTINNNYIDYIICIEGEVEIELKDETKVITKGNKATVNTNNFHGKTSMNSYIITKRN